MEDHVELQSVNSTVDSIQTEEKNVEEKISVSVFEIFTNLKIFGSLSLPKAFHNLTPPLVIFDQPRTSYVGANVLSDLNIFLCDNLWFARIKVSDLTLFFYVTIFGSQELKFLIWHFEIFIYD